MIQNQGALGATVDESSASAVSWGAIFAGGVTIAALSLVLLALGAGLGLSTVSPWSNSGVSATTFKVGTGLYLIVVAMLSSAIGGYVAGRLRTKWVGVHTHEVYFRDTAHGFLAWAVAALLSAGVLTSAITGLVGGAISTGTQAASTAASASSGPSAGYLDSLFRADPSGNRQPVNAATRDEVGRILAKSLASGEVAPADKTYIGQVIAAQTGISPEDAAKRLDEVVTTAKTYADNARKALLKLSLWLAASMLLGAFSASLAATDGGHVRDTQEWA